MSYSNGFFATNLDALNLISNNEIHFFERGEEKPSTVTKLDRENNSTKRQASSLKNQIDAASANIRAGKTSAGILLRSNSYAEHGGTSRDPNEVYFFRPEDLDDWSLPDTDKKRSSRLSRLAKNVKSKITERGSSLRPPSFFSRENVKSPTQDVENFSQPRQRRFSRGENGASQRSEIGNLSCPSSPAQLRFFRTKSPSEDIDDKPSGLPKKPRLFRGENAKSPVEGDLDESRPSSPKPIRFFSGENVASPSKDAKDIDGESRPVSQKPPLFFRSDIVKSPTRDIESPTPQKPLLFFRGENTKSPTQDIERSSSPKPARFFRGENAKSPTIESPSSPKPSLFFLGESIKSPTRSMEDDNCPRSPKPLRFFRGDSAKTPTKNVEIVSWFGLNSAARGNSHFQCLHAIPS